MYRRPRLQPWLSHCPLRQLQLQYVDTFPIHRESSGVARPWQPASAWPVRREKVPGGSGSLEIGHDRRKTASALSTRALRKAGHYYRGADGHLKADASYKPRDYFLTTIATVRTFSRSMGESVPKTNHDEPQAGWLELQSPISPSRDLRPLPPR